MANRDSGVAYADPTLPRRTSRVEHGVGDGNNFLRSVLHGVRPSDFGKQPWPAGESAAASPEIVAARTASPRNRFSTARSWAPPREMRTARGAVLLVKQNRPSTAPRRNLQA